jgi:hypothetical protein
MIKPDDQHKDTTPAELENDERAADQRKDTAAADIASGERTGRRPTSTAEVAKDLGRRNGGEQSDGAATLFAEKEASDFRTRWTDIQTRFVDEPRRSVEQADALVAEVTKRLADSFAQERSTLEGQWGRGDNVSTEDLRVALQRYRAFFDRLLKV